jgi:hypothetical protein
MLLAPAGQSIQLKIHHRQKLQLVLAKVAIKMAESVTCAIRSCNYISSSLITFPCETYNFCQLMLQLLPAQVATSAGDILEVECSALLGHQLEKSPMANNFNLPITGT